MDGKTKESREEIAQEWDGGMSGVPMPADEAERLRALHEYRLLELLPDAFFDEIVALSSYMLHTPMAAICFLDDRRLWFKASLGVTGTEVPREQSFCAHAILQPDGLVVPDALADPRFKANPFVQGAPGIRFYAGMPLFTRDHHALGTLCVADTRPHLHFDVRQREALRILARHLMAQIEVRQSTRSLTQTLLERNETEAEAHRRLLEHEQEMDRMSEMKDRFVTLLAHELRNPLAAILNALEILRSPDPQDAIEIVGTQVRHLTRLVEDLMDLSRVTRNKLTLKRVPLDLAEAVRSAVRAARAAFAKGGQPFVAELPAEPLWVEADPLRLEQIVSNLLGNAAKFTDPGKQVTLSLRGEETEAVLRVADQGIGIPSDMLNRIFEPFVQDDGGRNRGGLGLGLPLVRQLVHLHHGKVEAHSEGVGRGCEFVVRLPLLGSDVNAPEPPAAQPDAHRAPAVARRVLVIDDNAEFGATLKRLLDRWGHESMLVVSGTVALEKARSFQPHVALIDLGLPGMDGFSVAECLSGAPELNGLRLIAMSGFSEDVDRARAAKAGFHEFLLKPVDPGFLRQVLELAESPGQETHA